MEIKEITAQELRNIIDTREPIGLFYCNYQKNSFVACDNSTGDAWVEDFTTFSKTIAWLKGEFEVSDDDTEIEIQGHYINEEMIRTGLIKFVIKPVLEEDELICKIGESWFYFGGTEFEYADPKDIEFDILVNEIKSVLDNFYDSVCHGDNTYKDEYLYYYFYLCENI